MKKVIHLTDEQYLDLLKRIRKTLDSITEVIAEDSTLIGNKYTEANVGLCTDKFTTRETALWPKQFDTIGKVKYDHPHMHSMKYRRTHHRCPLDNRRRPDINGCFYTCLLFQSKFKTPSIQEVKNLYDELIKEKEEK